MASKNITSLVKKELIPFDERILSDLSDSRKTAVTPHFQDFHVKSMVTATLKGKVAVFGPCSDTKPYSTAQTWKTRKKLLTFTKEHDIPVFVQTAFIASHMNFDHHFPVAHYNFDDEGDGFDEVNWMLVRQCIMRVEDWIRKGSFEHIVVLARPKEEVGIFMIHRHLASKLGHKLYEVPSLETVEKICKTRSVMALSLALLSVAETMDEAIGVLDNLISGRSQEETRSPSASYYLSLMRLKSRRKA
jgi:hypothetical protein